MAIVPIWPSYLRTTQVHVSCPRGASMSTVLAALEGYIAQHPELPEGRSTHFWLFDFSSRQTAEGQSVASAHLDWVLGEIGRT